MSYQKISEIIKDGTKPIEQRRESKYHWFECVYSEDYEDDRCGASGNDKSTGTGVNDAAKRKQEKKL